MEQLISESREKNVNFVTKAGTSTNVDERQTKDVKKTTISKLQIYFI